MIGSAEFAMSNDAGITVTIRRRVKAGREAAFEAALRDFIPRALAFPGHPGVQVLRPDGNSPEWVVVVRFRSRADYDPFRTSSEYSQWCARIRELLDTDPLIEEQYGLESWFVLPGATSVPALPRWKMALVTWLGVNFAVTGLALAIGPFVRPWPLLPRALLDNA